MIMNQTKKEVEEVSCPVCDKVYPSVQIEEHVNKCIFLNTKSDAVSLKRPLNNPKMVSPSDNKKLKLKQVPAKNIKTPAEFEKSAKSEVKSENCGKVDTAIPLAEQMRPASLDEYIGQEHVLGHDKMLRHILNRNDIPSMILWGPPGCGKTSLANVIASICKSNNNMRFVKLSATMAGIADVKEVVNIAKNEMKFKRKTILFMDEIHRFNKLQQDTFLPHVENGTIVLIGATTENPSFSLNTALLSRCRVIVLEKLSLDNVMEILMRALKRNTNVLVVDPECKTTEIRNSGIVPRILVDKRSLKWLSEISDGDARFALSSLQLALQSKGTGDDVSDGGAKMITLDDIKDGIKRSHILYDKKGEEHYNAISALHKSIRASDDNASLYWLTRMMEGGEDPIYIARRLIRVAGEDIGLADSNALQIAVSCMQACQKVGMPECDVILAQCVVYLSRAPKSQEVYHALNACKQLIKEHKGAQPSVPLHLRNASTKLMSQLGYGKGYNTMHRDESNLEYMPAGMEDVDFFV